MKLTMLSLTFLRLVAKFAKCHNHYEQIVWNAPFQAHPQNEKSARASYLPIAAPPAFADSAF
jgi:hypothetical protein